MLSVLPTSTLLDGRASSELFLLLKNTSVISFEIEDGLLTSANITANAVSDAVPVGFEYQSFPGMFHCESMVKTIVF